MSTITIPSMDPTTYCRLCFSEINLLIVIRADSADPLSHGKLLLLVRNYLRLELGAAEDFPCAVCELCYGLLADFDSLYQQAHRNDDALRTLMKSGPQFPSATPQSTGTVYDTQESNLIEIFEPPLSMLEEIEFEKNIFEPESMVDSTFLEGRIVLEDVDYTDTTNQEQQVHVFHLDGELQQVVMAAESTQHAATSFTRSNGTHNGSARVPLTTSHKAAKKPTGTLKEHAVLKLTPVPRPSHKVFVKTIVPPKSGKDASKTVGRKPVPATVGRKNREKNALPTKQLFRCSKCSSLFVELANYYGHGCLQKPRTHASDPAHAGKLTPYECKQCDVRFRRELFLQKHLYEVHGISSENFGITCSICRIQFSQKQDYRLHVLAIHPN